MRLAKEQLESFSRLGHLTVSPIFSADEVDRAVKDVHAWGEEFLAGLAPDQRRWYLDGGVKSGEVLRKLDNPVFHRPVIRALATDRRLIDVVEAFIGRGVVAFFSQIFFKPPHGGGPKPVHQDNFYFGPRDDEKIITAWIAFDDADIDNGCMHFGEGSHLGPVHQHFAPPGEPFNLQVPPEIAARQPMTPAPVAKGGVSLHHGRVFHQSADNRSTRWRRACAVHYLHHRNELVKPALPYDPGLFVHLD